jgi:hypothetical protein
MHVPILDAWLEYVIKTFPHTSFPLMAHWLLCAMHVRTYVYGVQCTALLPDMDWHCCHVVGIDVISHDSHGGISTFRNLPPIEHGMVLFSTLR